MFLKYIPLVVPSPPPQPNKLFKPSYEDLVKYLFGLSSAKSQYTGYLYDSQPKKCQNDVFLENRVLIDKFL